MRTLTCWQLHTAFPAAPPSLSCGSFSSLWSGESVLSVCVFSGDNDVFQDPGHCFAEPQNQLGPLGRQPALPCSSERNMCPQGQNRASKQEGQGSPATGVEPGVERPTLGAPSSYWGRQGTSAIPDSNSPFLSHCRWDRPRVTKTTLDRPLPENSYHPGSQESPGPSGQPKARTSSPLWAFVPVVSLHPILPGKALKNITSALGKWASLFSPFHFSPSPPLHFCPSPPLLSP